MQFYKTTTDEMLRETADHGSDKYPIAYYFDEIRCKLHRVVYPALISINLKQFIVSETQYFSYKHFIFYINRFTYTKTDI